jgi:hypothetical protein
MAYQHISHPAEVMSRELTATRAFLDGLRGFFRNLGRSMIENSSAQRRVDLVHALQAKSDDELARMNLRREDIVHYVFRDLYYV